jgi:hypothetical protein
MSTTPDNHTPEGSAPERQGRSEFERPEDVTAFAREYFAADFPNPLREGCPAPGALLALVRSGQLPGDELRRHLFGCSKCFCDYREAIVLHRKSAAASARPSWLGVIAALMRKPVPVFASLLCIVVLVLAGVLLWRERRSSPASDIARTAPPPAASPSASPAATTEPSPIASAPRARPSVEIDLNDYTALRDASEPGGTGGKKIGLPPSRVSLQLTLPEGSRNGTYHVIILDVNNKTSASSKPLRSNGKRLVVPLDLSRLEEGNYRLSILRTGKDKTPDLYPVLISHSKAKPKP